MTNEPEQAGMIDYTRTSDGIVVLTMDDPGAGSNTMNELFRTSMEATLVRLHAELADITGVILTSAKRSFFAGGDLKSFINLRAEDAPALFEHSEKVKASLRALETLGRPVVAVVGGAALGGGFEICLAAHHRIVVDDDRIALGLPESTLGLLPGAGGVVRTVRMIGLEPALTHVLLPGARLSPARARELGLVDELVVDAEALVPAARSWILANADNASAIAKPWDRPGFEVPGGDIGSPDIAALLPSLPAALRKKSRGAVNLAHQAILCAAVDGLAVDFDTALRIETRYFVTLAVGQQAKNMIQAFFFDQQALSGGALRPEGFPQVSAKAVGVLGAGMMGAGIAYSCAKSGARVVLKDVTIERATAGKEYSTRIMDKLVSSGRATEAEKTALLDRILPTVDPADFAGCDVVIEAVFEDPQVKVGVFADVAPLLANDVMLCSNTSTLPITALADGVGNANRFIGLHFFSPVDRMPLVEIVRGAETADATLARAYDLVQQLRKTPIVVNDSRGFYTSRLINVRIKEAMAMLAEGIDPRSIERAALQAGFPVGCLQLTDELNMELLAHVREAAREAADQDGNAFAEHPADAVIDAMTAAGRPGRAKGAGFYDYSPEGKRLRLWSGLPSMFPSAPHLIPFADIKDRLLFVEPLETVKCFEEGVIGSSAAANIGSILGLGFPSTTGGTAQLIAGYEDVSGDIGPEAFIRRADALASVYGDRFSTSEYLRDLTARGENLPA